MADLYHEQTATLTPEDIRKLRDTINKLPVILVIMVVVGAIIVYITDSGIIGIGIFAAVILLISYAFYTGAGRYRQLIANGTKVILQGIITARYDRYPNGDGDSSKEYFFKVGEREIQVDLSTYRKYYPGNSIEIHYVPMGLNSQQFILSHALLPHTDIQPKSGTTSKL